MKKLVAVLIVIAAVVAIAVYSYKQYKKFYPTPLDLPTAPGPQQQQTQPGQQPPEAPR